ncbi:unnamed protein product [Zymoseptoria tritici ST99CH_3D1]|nr:unnamed protein product [Zymoseptoria tritici ST99CH_3D1]
MATTPHHQQALPAARQGSPNMAIAADASNHEDRSTFHFFDDVPRELRDLIYEYALHAPQRFLLGNSKFTVQPRRVPCSHLLTVSRQFKSEYMSCADKLATLDIFDHGESLPQPQEIVSLPSPALNISSLALHLIAESSDPSFPDMDLHMKWVRHIMSMLPRLRSLNVTVHANSEDLARIFGIKKAVAPWVQLTVLKEFEVYKTPTFMMPNLWSVSGHEGMKTPDFLVTRWSLQRGEWEDSTDKGPVLIGLLDDVQDEEDGGEDSGDAGDDVEHDEERTSVKDEDKEEHNEEELTAADDESDEEWLAPVNPYEYDTEEYRQFKREVLDA